MTALSRPARGPSACWVIAWLLCCGEVWSGGWFGDRLLGPAQQGRWWDRSDLAGDFSAVAQDQQRGDRVLKTLRATGPQTANELVSALARQGRAIRPTTVETALGELAAMGLAAPDVTGPARRWSPLAPSGDPLLDAVDLRGAHDFRHTFATWLEDAGIPARVIDELMGHEASTRGAQHLGSTMGAHYRHTTPEMATRVVMAIQTRLVVVVSVAEQVVEAQPTRVPRNVF
jgi:Phage integrase family/Penicillinase repressor